MARRSTGKPATSTGATTPGGKGTGGAVSPKGGAGKQASEASATKGAIREEFFRKKDGLLKLKSLDIFLTKDAMGINIGTTDMKPELREIVKKLLSRKSKT
ncbi:hypothetical protein [Chroococcidiopsis sp.]|uniref:hypothetical protein n=1 Tax=Chroococcidiopsis sp. TaxID=3088168 RepID=UPI003F2B8AD1